MLKKFTDNIWTFDHDFKYYGIEIGTRMTVVDFSGNGDLLIHSPVKPTEIVKQQLNEIGSVKAIVAPNRWHHLHVNPFREFFHEAKLYGASGLEKKRTDVAFDGIIEDEKEYEWSSLLKHHVVQGAPMFNEAVFFHDSSKTLIVTDLGVNICNDSPFLTRLIFKLIGNYNQLGWGEIEKKIFIKDSEKFKNSISRILQWDFEKIILSHGSLIRSDAKSHFRTAFT